MSKSPVVNRMILRYSAELNALAREAEQKEVFEFMFYSNGICSFFPEGIEAAWEPAVKRCKWVLGHLDAFKDEDGVYDGNELMRVLGL